MSLDSPLEAVKPVTPVPSRAQPRSQQGSASRADSAGQGSFAQMLRGQQNAIGAKKGATPDLSADNTAPQANTTARQPGQKAEGEGQADAPDAEKAGKEEGQRSDVPKKLALTAEDLPAVPSTLALAGARDDSAAATGGLDALKGRTGGGRRAGEAGIGKGAEAGEAENAANAAGFRSSLLAATKEAGADSADAAAHSLAAAPLAEAERKGESDGSLPSLAGLVETAGPHKTPEHTPGAEAAAPAQAELPVPPDSPLFPQALGVQLSTWMDEGVSHAMLALNPEDLGPIEVRIAVHEGATRIELGAEVASTRSALSEALPQLADQLGDVGLSLAGGSVSDQTGQQRQGDQPGAQASSFSRALGQATGRDSGDSALDGARMAAPREVTNHRGLLSLYA